MSIISHNQLIPRPWIPADAPLYRKAATITARPASVGETIETHLADGTAQRLRERAVGAAEFAATYAAVESA